MQIRHYQAVGLCVQPLRKALPFRETSSLSATEHQLLNNWLDDWEKKGIQYFIDNCKSSGLILDRAKQIDIPNGHLDQLTKERITTMSSIAATGYGLVALMLAVERNMLPLQQARNLVLQTFSTITSNMTSQQSGWMYHFVKAGSGKPYPGSEVSSIDTTIFLLSALIAGEYFGGKVKQQAKDLFDQVDFPMMLTNDNQILDKQTFSHGFYIKNRQRSFIDCNWDRYSEGVMVPLLALGATKHWVPHSVWHSGWDRSKRWQYGKLKTFAPLPLFTYFFPLGFFNLKDRKDSQGENFWQEAQKAVKMQLAYCRDHGYPKGSFGLSACDGPSGYTAYAPDDKSPDKTISILAIIACLPLNEKEVFKWCRHAKLSDLDRYKYGLPGAYEPKSTWLGIASDTIGIDIGSTLLMIDAYKRGLIHKLSDQNVVIQRALQRAGFL